jgi:hypothetical protein
VLLIINTKSRRRNEAHLQTGPHALTVFALRPFVDFEVRASFEPLDGRLSVGSGIERASAASSLGLFSDFFGSWMISFAWGVWLSGPSLPDHFLLCCRPRLSASFCFCKCGEVSLKAHYPNWWSQGTFNARFDIEDSAREAALGLGLLCWTESMTRTILEAKSELVSSNRVERRSTVRLNLVYRRMWFCTSSQNFPLRGTYCTSTYHGSCM